MKAVILVGGEATRLRPLTDNIPKAMVPVLNIPFMEHVIRHLSQHGIKDIILTLGQLSQSMESYFGDGKRLGVKLIHSLEVTPLGTAGAVKNAERYLDETFLALNGDILTDLDITAMIDFHRERKSTATIAITAVDDPTSYGVVETDAQGRVTRFLEKPGWSQVTTNMINAGTYVLETEVLKYIPPQTKFSFERELFPLLLEKGRPIHAYPSSTYCIDIGTPEKYLQLTHDLLNGKIGQYALTQGEEVQVGEQGHIHPTAQLEGPVVIGDDCTIGRGVRLTGPVVIGSGSIILDNAVIEGSILWQNVRLKERVSLKNSILANNCCLEADSIVEDAVLGDKVTVASGCRVEPGSRVQAGKVIS